MRYSHRLLKLSSLKVGDGLTVYVEEDLHDGNLIVRYDGHLLRVKNSTGRIFLPESRLNLVVADINPLEFKILKTPIANTGFSCLA